MSELFEVAMVVLFGVSWPVSIAKSWRSKTTKGKSLLFICLVWVGYVCGITSKLTAANVTYVLVFYCLNLVMVSIDLVLYIRNRRLDRLRDAQTPTA